jgi:hypothetical protein
MLPHYVGFCPVNNALIGRYGIAVYGDEYICIIFVGNICAVIQLDKRIVVARVDNFYVIKILFYDTA